MIKPIIELIDGTAYRPDSPNPEAPLRTRFVKNTLLGISLGREIFRIGPVKFDRAGNPIVGGVSSVNLAGISNADATIQKVISDAIMKHKTSDAVLLLAPDLFLSTSEQSFRGRDVDRNRLLADDPQQITGMNVTSQLTYGFISHPKMNRGIAVSASRQSIDDMVTKAREWGVNIVRVQPATYSLLRWALEEHHTVVEGKDLLVIDDSFAAIVIDGKGDWVDVGFKMDNSLSVDLAAGIRDLLDRRHDTAKPLVWISTRDLHAAGALLPSGAERLLPHTNADFYAACAEGEGRLAVDFNTIPTPYRPHLPQKYRIGAIVCALVVGVSIVASLGFHFQSDRNAKQTAEIHGSTATMDAESAKIDSQLKQIAVDQKRAERIGKWVVQGIYVQPLLASAMHATGNDVVLDSFSIILAPGQPQMEMKFVARGEGRKTGQFVDTLLRGLQNANFRLVNPRQDSLPGGGSGVSFSGQFIYPSPLDANWKGAFKK